MAIDSRVGNKVMKSQRREDAPGTRVDPYPYIGIVKNNLDPTRCGRLQVWIPDLGGDENDPKNWRTVSYYSPYMGTTNISKGASKTPNKENKWNNTAHTYGMWMVPPDVGIEIICIFIAGDPLRGYWMGCVNSSISRFMIPAVASTDKFVTDGTSADVKETAAASGIAPVTEFNIYDPQAAQKPAFYTNPKPIHEPQYKILKEQGLDRDKIRGPITSSSQRESPSQVFGISTPGRPFPDNGADNPKAYQSKVQAGKLTEDDYRYATRKGGHTFIMDDGNLIGEDQLVRLRTASGHQIMMNDTKKSLYINHADGSSWVELAADGSIHIYAKNGMNVRSEGTINFHTDKDFNINAVNDVNIKAGKRFQLNSTNSFLLQNTLNIESLGQSEHKVGAGYNLDVAAKTSIKSGGVIAMQGSKILQNSGGTSSAKAVKPITVNSLADAARASSTALWLEVPGKLSTIVTIAPTHEPWTRGTGA